MPWLEPLSRLWLDAVSCHMGRLGGQAMKIVNNSDETEPRNRVIVQVSNRVRLLLCGVLAISSPSTCGTAEEFGQPWQLCRVQVRAKKELIAATNGRSTPHAPAVVIVVY